MRVPESLLLPFCRFERILPDEEYPFFGAYLNNPYSWLPVTAIEEVKYLWKTSKMIKGTNETKIVPANIAPKSVECSPAQSRRRTAMRCGKRLS
jgi:hypothetical protein